MKSLFRFLLVPAVALLIQACGNSSTPQGAPPALGAGAVQFASGNCALRIPFRMVDQLLIVPVAVNDSLKLEMIFDTGFGNEGAILFDPAAGGRLGLAYAASVNLGGGGEAAIRTANVATGATLSLPGVRFVQQPLLVMSNKEAFRDWPADGIIGKTLCASLVEIDYERGVLNLYDGMATRPAEQGQEFKVTFSYGIPVMEAAAVLEGKQELALKLLLDTGVSFPLCLFTYSEERIQLPPRTIALTDEGLNGVMRCRVGRVAALKFGTFVLDQPLTGFLDQTAMGSATILGQNGFFGQEALQLFKVVLDYAGARVFLAPNASYPGSFDFNMAGLYLKTLPGGQLQVREVVEQSPAAEKGIEKDDQIVAVNGREVREIARLELHRLFLQNGATLRLTVLRGGQQLEHALVLKRLI
ncbi:MAG: hypothetical protein DKINENOH_01267 [bacterium]|nr:hypothetical protein [bacterium]